MKKNYTLVAVFTLIIAFAVTFSFAQGGEVPDGCSEGAITGAHCSGWHGTYDQRSPCGFPVRVPNLYCCYHMAHPEQR